MDIQKKLIKLSYWIWRNMAKDRVPFYINPALHRHKTFTEPPGRIRKWIWRRAVDYLVAIGELTHTPTLKEKF